MRSLASIVSSFISPFFCVPVNYFSREMEDKNLFIYSYSYRFSRLTNLPENSGKNCMVTSIITRMLALVQLLVEKKMKYVHNFFDHKAKKMYCENVSLACDSYTKACRVHLARYSNNN